jgi:hypothetical protein
VDKNVTSAIVNQLEPIAPHTSKSIANSAPNLPINHNQLFLARLQDHADFTRGLEKLTKM